MDAGFEILVFGATYTMINQTDRCLSLKRKIKISDLPYVGEAWSVVNPWDKELLFTCTYDFGYLPQYRLTLNADELIWAITVCKNISKSITVKRPSMTEVCFNIPSGTNLDGVYIYTYGFTKNSNSHCGLQVFNSEGNVVFDGGVPQFEVYRADVGTFLGGAKPWATALVGPAFWNKMDPTWYFEVTDWNVKQETLYPEPYIVVPKGNNKCMRYEYDSLVGAVVADVSKC